MEGGTTGGRAVSAQDNVEPINPFGDDDLAEVIELPISDAPSFYQRNSGSLPRANNGITDSHRREKLPTPENSDKTSLTDAIRSLLRR